MNSDGKVENTELNGSRFAYNDGVMISASIKMYEITKNEDYLNNAKISASAASKQYIYKNKVMLNTLDMQNNPWFNQLLIQGFVDLYPYDKDISNEAMDKIISILDYAYTKNRNKDGFISKEWAKGWSKSNDNKIEILNQAGTTDSLAEVAYFLKNIKDKNGN